MEKSYVGIEQYQCPICGKIYDSGRLLFDTRLKNSFEKFVITEMVRCENCKEKEREGYVAILKADKKIANGRYIHEVFMWIDKRILEQSSNEYKGEPAVYMMKEEYEKLNKIITELEKK